VNMDEVNMDEVNMDEVNMNEVNMNEVNMNEVNAVNVNKMNEVAPEVSTVNKVNEESIEIKEEMSEGKPLEVMRRDSLAAKSEVRTNWEPGESGAGKFEEVKSNVNAEAKVEVSGAVNSSCVVKGKPPEVPQRFDFAAKVQMEEFGTKEVAQIDDMKMKEESLYADWDPGELIDTKAKVEMLDAKEVDILVSNAKVEVRLSKKEARLRGDVTTKALLNAMTLCNFVRLYISEVLVLVALNVARFVNVNPMSSRTFAESFLPTLSDYG